MAESLDSLFDAANKDTVATQSGTNKINALDRPVFLYFGTLETQGILDSGWNEDHRDTPVTSLYYFLHFQGGIDVQPIPQARLIGTFSTYLPQDLDADIVNNIRSGSTQSGTGTTTTTTVNTKQTLAIDELFLDYTIYDSAFFRIGKFAQTWGLGHLFNPGNLVTDTTEGVNLKGFASAGPFSLTGLVIANPKFFSDTSHPRADEMGYAGSLGYTFGSVTGNFAAYEQRGEGGTLDAGLKTSLFGFDVYAEALGYRNASDGQWRPDDRWRPGLMAGIFYDLKTEWEWKLLAEYWLDGSTAEAKRNIAFGASSDPVIKGLDLRLNVKWYHSLSDRSGQLVTGIDITPLPKLNIALGVPWTYGPADGTFVTGNTDPEKRLLSGLLTIGVKFDFEKAR